MDVSGTVLMATNASGIYKKEDPGTGSMNK